jgi:hypothetical protein
MKRQILSLVFWTSISILTVFGVYCVSSVACDNLQAKNIKCANVSVAFCPVGVSEADCISKSDRTTPHNNPLDYEEAKDEKLVDVTVVNPEDGLTCYSYAPCKYYPNGLCMHDVNVTVVKDISWWETAPCE